MKRNRNIFLLLIGILLLLSCNEEKAVKNTKSEIKRPNIVLIMADDQGWGDLSISGNTNLSTPNIDALAKNGVSFENFYVQPVCSPTRAELLTGRSAAKIGVYSTSEGGERFNLGETTLAQIFKKAGYRTAAYGKWHSGMQPPYHPNSRGFDDYYGFASGHWGNYFSPMLEHNGEIVKGKGFLVDDLTDHGINFIEKNKEQPFFLYLPYNTPHSPMQVPDEFWNRFKDKELDSLYHGTETEDLNFTKAALAMVENIDYNVGRLTHSLKELDLEENTIVIYLSDNGPNGWRWNGGMKGKKGSTNEGGVRTPFFIQWKNALKAGKKYRTSQVLLIFCQPLSNWRTLLIPAKKNLMEKI
ncbi:sulfatase-like hydrolase/transferase [Maribacter halichondriae]|uniref:sulfatase-like hydrolase/transferase n=1 Tax=Maribacter halichondriae TaxID=2980554 RepID=UPI00235851D8|nr:sulfatase-like hydrolase/transferase [Maribacter sp. Hal144]